MKTDQIRKEHQISVFKRRYNRVRLLNWAIWAMALCALVTAFCLAAIVEAF